MPARPDQAEREFAQVDPVSHNVVSLLNAVERHAKQDAGAERRTGNRPWSNSKPKVQTKPAARRAATGGNDSEWEDF